MPFDKNVYIFFFTTNLLTSKEWLPDIGLVHELLAVEFFALNLTHVFHFVGTFLVNKNQNEKFQELGR